jgi:hypothetical protein
LADEQAMQVPVHVPSQQKPSTQLPSRQSLPTEQGSPVDFLPTQVPPEQVLPVRQSLSLVQVPLHAVADAQIRPPVHDFAVASGHEPALQLLWGT